ncbi:hypothetical protein SESBI_01435 [Sesbania bispinosa]|nr:hypothetical protein SESBI_01435 [Sesbania bispinosa]
MTGTASGSQRKGLRVKSPARRVESSGVSSINDSVGKQIEGKDAAASQNHNMATKSKVAEVVKEKSPAQSRHNMGKVNLKSSTEAVVGQGQGQVNLKSPTEAGVGQSQGQGHLRRSVRKADVGKKPDCRTRSPTNCDK